MAAAAEGPDHPPHALDGLAVEGFLPHGPQQRHRQGNASQAVRMCAYYADVAVSQVRRKQN